MNKYDRYVAKCREYVKKRDDFKWEIAKMSLELYPIKVRGHSKVQSTARKSYLDFSKDIGLNEVTLKHWRRLYVKVVSKVPLSKIAKLNTEQLRKIASTVGYNDSGARVLKLTNATTKEDRDVTYLRYLVRQQSAIEYNICSRLNLAKMDNDDLKAIKYGCEKIIAKLSKYKAKSGRGRDYYQKTN